MNKRKKLLSVCAMLIAVLGVGELSVRAYCWTTEKPMPLADESLENEREWVRLRLHKEDFRSSVFAYDPDIGWINRENRSDKKHTTNAQGMRNTSDISVTPAVGHKRVMILGASYIFGMFVNIDETFPYILEKQHLSANWQVLNMGVSGTGTDQQYLIFEKHGKKYQSNIVIMGFHVRNYFHNVSTFTRYAKPRFVLAGDDLQLVNSPVLPPQDLINSYKSGERSFASWHDSYLWNYVGKMMRKNSLRDIDSSAEAWLILSRLMEKFQKSVAENGATPVWMVLPSRDVLEQEHSRYERLEQLCEKRSRELGMLCLRLDKPLREAHRQGQEVFRPDNKGGHFSVAGHQLTARVIFEFLSQHGLLDDK